MNTTIEPTVSTRTPPAHTRGSHLLPLQRLSQKEVARLLGVVPQAVQAREAVALAKLRNALKDDPDVVCAVDPDLAARHHLVPRKEGRVFGGRYMTDRHRNFVVAALRRARWWEYAASKADCEKDAAGCREAARAIRQEVENLRDRLSRT